MIASLPMYDRLETTAANDRLWAMVRDALGFGPAKLDRILPNWEVWQSRDLLMSQTCGMPFRTRLHGKVQLVGTPDYGLAGAEPGYYYSVFVVQTGAGEILDHFADRRFAYNAADSQSGWAAPQNHALSQGWCFSDCIATGSHLASAAAVAEGRADIAALDAVTWRMIDKFDDLSGRLQVIARTAQTPGLPLITGSKVDKTELFDAIAASIQNLGRTDRDSLGIRGIRHIPAKTYLSVKNPPCPDVSLK